jgi:hypothetical protein
MTYQAYLDSIKAKTGKTPADFRALAQDKGLLEPGVKAGEVVRWLKEDYGLGHGHAMAAKSYISLVRNGKKFAIVQVTSNRFDVGIKLKGTAPTQRLTPAGSWNAMVTHRVAIDDPAGVDPELIGWMRRAYEVA